MIEALRREISSTSSEDESNSEEENITGEDIGILEEANWDDEDGSIGNSSEDDLVSRLKDPDWNANMEDEQTDSSDDDELSERDAPENMLPDER